MKSLEYYVSVTKGRDIRLVYNGTLSGLDDALWDPHFAIPTVTSTLRSV